MPEGPRYASLQDYLALLRRQRWVVILVTLVFAGAALALALRQTPTYVAEADVTVHDISEDLRILGVSSNPNVAPAQQAAAAAQVSTRLAVAQRVKRQLRTRLSPQQLQGAVTAKVGTLTGLVLLQGSWSNARFATDIANAFARQAVDLARKQQNRQLDTAIANLRRRAGRLDQPALTAGQQQAQLQLSNLLTVRRIVKPAEVTERAQVPTAPVSPKPVRDAVLGGLLGLAVALAAAFVRDSLDRRIRGSKEAHDELALPVIGRVGLSALGSAGLATNGRRPLSPVDLESFRMLRTNLAFFNPEAPPRLVLVTSGTPGEGKSTVAAAISTAAAAAGQRTLLVEGDLRRPTLAKRMGLRESPGLTDYLMGRASPNEILQVHSVTLGGHRNGVATAPDHEGLSLVCITAGGPVENAAELLASQRAHDFLAKVRKVYDLVVVDSSPLLSAADPLELVPYVDGVVLCVRVGWSTRDDVRATKAALGRLPHRPTGVVITGLRSSDEEYAYYGYAGQV